MPVSRATRLSSRQDAGHVDVVGHRLRQAEELGHPDRRRLLGLGRERAVLLDLLLGRCGLLLQLGRLPALRRDEQEEAGRAVDEQPDDDACDDGWVRRPSHEAPAAFTVALIWNSTTLRPVSLGSAELCWSWTPDR